MIKYICIIFCLFVLTSHSNVHLNDLVHINKNLTYAKAKNIYGDEFNFNEDLVELDIDKESFKMIYFEIETDANVKSNPSLSSRGNIELIVNTSEFFIIFKNNNYFSSGFEHQIMLSKNDKILDVFSKLHKKKRLM